MGQYIAIIGPKGSGKTTLGTRIISSSRTRGYKVIRIYLNTRHKGAPELVDKPELRWYDEAGAEDVIGLMCNKDNYEEAINGQMSSYYTWEGRDFNAIIEGSGDIYTAITYDVVVFVMGVLGIDEDIEKPLKNGQSKSRGQILTIKPPPIEKVLISLSKKIQAGEKVPDDQVGMDERIRQEMLEHITIITQRSLLPKYQALDYARIIIINRREDDVKEQVKITQNKVKNYLDETSWYRGYKKKLVYVADLMDKKDVNLRNALTAIKRSIL
jgi:adenylate kinase family enzyme